MKLCLGIASWNPRFFHHSTSNSFYSNFIIGGSIRVAGFQIQTLSLILLLQACWLHHKSPYIQILMGCQLSCHKNMVFSSPTSNLMMLIARSLNFRMALQPNCTLMGLLTVHRHLIITKIFITFDSWLLSEPPNKTVGTQHTQRLIEENIYI